MHGGISHRLKDLEAINEVDRRMEPGDDTLLADLLWADPVKSKYADTTEFNPNNKRGISVEFGKAPLKALLKKIKMKAVVRAHEVQESGYKFHSWDGNNEFPPCITLFSAPNYCGHGNDAAVMISSGEAVDIRTFEEKKGKPVVLPAPVNDVFSFFQPRLQGLVLDAVYQIIKFQVCSQSVGLAKTLSSTASVDLDYIKKVVKASKQYQGADEEQKTSANN